MSSQSARRNPDLLGKLSPKLIVTSFWGIMLFGSFVDGVKAMPHPLEIDSASPPEQKEAIITAPTPELEAKETIPISDSLSVKTGELADHNSPSPLATNPSTFSVTTSETENTTATLKEWKANLPATQASQLLPAGDNNSPEIEKWRSQTSPPVDPNISPELQRLRQDFLIEEPKTLSVKLAEVVVAPGASISTPIGFGASFGQIFGGFGFQSRTRFTNEADGGFALGVGLGEPQKIVGLDVTMAILSLFGDNAGRGSFSFKIHRSLPEGFAVALGFENAIRWGGTDAGSSIYGVVSKFFQFTETTKEPLSQLTLSLGVGGGRFRSEGAIEDGVNSVGVFASAGLRLVEPVSAIVEWSGQDLNAGISLIPFPKVPLTINLAGADLTGNAGDGARFVMSIGYNYFFPR